MGGIHERPVYRTELPIKGGGGLGQFANSTGEGVLGKEGEVRLIPQCVLWLFIFLLR